jgi:hypothetical protein
LEPKEQLALEVLCEFLPLEALEGVDTCKGSSLPFLEIGSMDTATDSIPVHVQKIVKDKSGETFDGGIYTGISYASQCVQTAQNLIHRWGETHHRDVNAALEDVLVYEAHRSLGHDLLVTKSHWLTAPEFSRTFRDTNRCGPLEALRLVGLFLRCRDLYVVANHGCRVTINRTGFYEVLAELRVPSLRTFRALLAQAARSDDIMAIARSVVIRCERALQARDYIARTFYSSRNARDLDEALYHFDYLTLLLQGALDGLARIACRVYALTFSEYKAAFHSPGFCSALESAGAIQLGLVVTSERAVSLFALLTKLRNTIHAAALEGFGVMTHGNEGWRRILLTRSPLAGELWEITDRLGGATKWGLSRMRHGAVNGLAQEDDTVLEVYPCAFELTRETLAHIDEIVLATEVSRLFSDRVPDAGNQRYSNLPSPQLRERIDLLG